MNFLNEGLRIEALTPTMTQLQNDLVQKFDEIMNANPPLSLDDMKSYCDDVRAVEPQVERMGKVLTDLKDTIAGWTIQGATCWGKFKRLFKANGVGKEFDDLAEQMRHAELSLTTALR
jgi:hypothetical protein